jgi:hypothetical protein
MEDGGRNLLRAEGLFSKMTHDGVLANLDRWILNERMGLDQMRERGGGWPEMEKDAVAQPLMVARSSPENRKQGLRATVQRTEGTGRERRQRRVYAGA